MKSPMRKIEAGNNTLVDAAQWLNEEDHDTPLARATVDGIELAAYPHSGGFNHYTIDWDRLNEPLKVVWWIRHLTDKEWFTADMCRDFINAVAKHWGWQGGAL